MGTRVILLIFSQNKLFHTNFYAQNKQYSCFFSFLRITAFKPIPEPKIRLMYADFYEMTTLRPISKLGISIMSVMNESDPSSPPPIDHLCKLVKYLPYSNLTLSRESQANTSDLKEYCWRVPFFVHFHFYKPFIFWTSELKVSKFIILSLYWSNVLG